MKDLNALVKQLEMLIDATSNEQIELQENVEKIKIALE